MQRLLDSAFQNKAREDMRGSVHQTLAEKDFRAQLEASLSAVFHKKIRASRGGQEKYERKNSERTKVVNPTPCGHSIG
jgi:hypothetical protein